MNALVVNLLILSVLVCPYNCTLQRLAEEETARAAKPACCERCAARKADAEKQGAPIAPKHEDDGGCCICDGAVSNPAEQERADAGDHFSLWTGLRDGSEGPSVALGVHRRAGSVLLAFLDGRSVRVALGSLVI